MMKKSIYLLPFLILICSCSSTKDKYEAVNNYLETTVKDTIKEIIILKEKLNPNETIYIFKDANEYERVSKTDVKKGDVTVDTLLYNEKDWKKMDQKYGDGSLFITETFLPERNNWKPSDFRLKSIQYENKDKYYDSVQNGKYYDVFERKEIYRFSEPIYYKSKKYIVFTVSSGGETGTYSTVVVVMKKVKGKWVQKYQIGTPWHS